MRDFRHFLAGHKKAALVSLEQVSGSAPRDEGAWMLVSNNATFGSIGGGVLEWEAITRARKILNSEFSGRQIYSLQLGPDSGQCCGGVVEYSVFAGGNEQVEFMISTAHSGGTQAPHVFVFGAGHVGLALAGLLSELPFSTHLVDSRESALENAPDGVRAHLTSIEESLVESAPSGSSFVVMTHDHGRDFLIVAAALSRGDARYVGLIGSKTKRSRFERYFRDNGGSEASLKMLTCPIGEGTNRNKSPEVIAILTAAELLNAIGRDARTSNVDDGAESLAKSRG